MKTTTSNQERTPTKILFLMNRPIPGSVYIISFHRQQKKDSNSGHGRYIHHWENTFQLEFSFKNITDPLTTLCHPPNIHLFSTTTPAILHFTDTAFSNSARTTTTTFPMYRKRQVRIFRMTVTHGD